MMPFRFTGLPLDQFRPLFALSDDALLARGMRRHVADSKPGFPCRVTLEDAEPGENVILLSYAHQPAAGSPYQAQGPIFVRQSATTSYDRVDEIPPVLPGRLLSLRGYDQEDLIVEAEVVDGAGLETELDRFFVNRQVSYVHIHYARRGCFACRVDRR
jgi:hypothetical protein